MSADKETLAVTTVSRPSFTVNQTITPQTCSWPAGSFPPAGSRAQLPPQSVLLTGRVKDQVHLTDPPGRVKGCVYEQPYNNDGCYS